MSEEQHIGRTVFGQDSQHRVIRIADDNGHGLKSSPAALCAPLITLVTSLEQDAVRIFCHHGARTKNRPTVNANQSTGQVPSGQIASLWVGGHGAQVSDAAVRQPAPQGSLADRGRCGGDELGVDGGHEAVHTQTALFEQRRRMRDERKIKNHRNHIWR